LLASTDVAVLLCHGYRAPRGNEVGVLLADGGRLPSGDPVDHKQFRRHLFSWRDAERLQRSARTVLSAACSTAYSYGAGLGDRLGLAGALRFAGTTALVAPVWEVAAADVLPILERTIVRYRAGEPLAGALRSVAMEAATSGPDWMVWSLALEGDWR
jgi:CHAT domain-containing protein